MLRSLKTSVRELPDGFEFQYPSDMKTYQLVAEWAAGERVCCPFFEIDLRSEPEGGPLWLRLTGRDGVKEFIHARARPGSSPDPRKNCVSSYEETFYETIRLGGDVASVAEQYHLGSERNA